MLKTAKQTLLRLAGSWGVFDRFAESQWRANRLLILAYHGVSLDDEHLWHPELFVSPAALRGRLDTIRSRGYSVLPLTTALDRLYAGALHTPAVALTFDDGFYNFVKCALPILEEYECPATLYLTTYYCHHNQPVFPLAVSYLLWKAGPQTLRTERVVDADVDLSLTDGTGRAHAHRLICDYARSNALTSDQQDALLATLSAELGIDYADFCRRRLLHLVNEDEVAEVAAAGVDIQLHTHRHRVPDDEREFRREIGDNRRTILAATSGAAGESGLRHFCYPSGEHRARHLPWLRAERIASATTCDTGLATADTNPLLLPRLVDTSLLSDVEFEGWLSGLSRFLPHRRRASR